MKNTINGIVFQGMIRNALHNLINAEKEINSMNVFPVADGDTGTNMRLTLENGYKKAEPTKHLGNYIEKLASGMLLGARGNSGVILSQLFKGMSNELSSKGIVNPREIKNGLIEAYKAAYQAVVNPVEGTILTVSRLGIENIKNKITGDINIAETFRLYLEEMENSLKDTPNLLQVLKDAGVLDSGAYGYIKIIEGMYKYLIGEIIDSGDNVKVEENKPVLQSFFDENSQFIDGYCMEFLLQLMNAKNYKDAFNLTAYINSLKPFGNSIVALQEGSIVKVHIHTLMPSEVISLSRLYGEFVSFKLENMQLQHNEFGLVEKREKKKLAIVAVVDGGGIESAYKDMGVDVIIQGGQTMNTSAEEFVNAINSTYADDVVVFPNNINIVSSAQQAVRIMNANNVHIIPTRTVIEAFYALQMDVPEFSNSERISSFNENIYKVSTITVSKAIKKYDCEGFSCDVGDQIACINDNLVSSKKTTMDAFKEAMSKIKDIDEKCALIVFLGKNHEENLGSQIEDFIYDNYSHLDISVIEGGENVYDIVAGVF